MHHNTHINYIFQGLTPISPDPDFLTPIPPVTSSGKSGAPLFPLFGSTQCHGLRNMRSRAG